MSTITQAVPDSQEALFAEAKKLNGQCEAILTNKVSTGKGDETRAATSEELESVEERMTAAREYTAKAINLKEIEQVGADIEAHMTAAPGENGTDPDPTDYTGNWSPMNGPEDKAVTKAQRQRRSKQSNIPMGGFGDWGRYLIEVHKAMVMRQKPHKNLAWVEFDDIKQAERKADMEQGIGARGGFLVPIEQDSRMLSVGAEDTTIRDRAVVIPMGRRELRIPVVDQTGTTAGVPHWFGGMSFTWTEEAGEKSQSDPTFRQMKLIAHKLTGYTVASDELLEDSAVSLAAFLSSPLGFAGGSAWTWEWAYLNGTGAGQPLGVINAPATISEVRNTANAISFGDLVSMASQFLPNSRGMWHISQSAYASIVQLSGPTGNPSFIWQPNARDGVPDMLLGYPVTWSEKNPILGAAGDVVLADWSKYLIGDRKATTIESNSTGTTWRNDQTEWRMISRGDGRPWLSLPLTYQDGTTQVSPFVILDSTADGS